MSDTAKEILIGLLNNPRADTGAEHRFPDDSLKKSQELQAIKELANMGYVIKTGSSLGFVVCVLTDAGRAAAELL